VHLETPALNAIDLLRFDPGRRGILAGRLIGGIANLIPIEERGESLLSLAIGRRIG
jgi:hypothetical protein